MNKAYSGLAKVYEHFICDSDYERWADFVVQTMKKYFVGADGVDCACGSGYFTRALKRAGFDVVGLDSSQEMLQQAVANCSKEKLKIDFLLMDMTNLKLMKKVDFITVINDGVNYVEKSKAKKTFSAFSKNLNRNGLLFFDVSSEFKIKNIISNNLFGEDDEQCSYLWFNNIFDDRVEMDISLFLKNSDGTYTKKEERHTQYIYTRAELEQLLRECGFEVISVTEAFGNELTATSERLIFTARKI